ncbi:unnamed protein product [Brassica oleracea]
MMLMSRGQPQVYFHLVKHWIAKYPGQLKRSFWITTTTPPEIQTTASSASSDKIRICDWTCDDVIAEGGLFSTDLKQLVNNILFGPNAAIVKIEKVIKKEALWRPSPEMSTIDDALRLSIAWPIQKIDIINQSPFRVSPLFSSPRSVSNILDTAKSSP